MPEILVKILRAPILDFTLAGSPTNALLPQVSLLETDVEKVGWVLVLLGFCAYVCFTNDPSGVSYAAGGY